MYKPRNWLLTIVAVLTMGGIGCGLFPAPENADLDPFIGAGPFGPFTGVILDEDGNQVDPNGDEDGDNVINAEDNCIGVAGPVENAGCPLNSNSDEDGDGVPNGADGCPFDFGPSQAGGCPLDPDGDFDGDGVPNGNDACPFEAGTGDNGCSAEEPEEPEEPTDSDGDGVPDQSDGCPNDPNKVAPGACGCGVPDIDSDGDGVLNCQDDCPYEAGDGPNGCPLQGDLNVDPSGVEYDVSIRDEGWSILTVLDGVEVQNPNTGQWFRLDELTLRYVSSVWMLNGVKQYYGVCKYPGTTPPDGCTCGDGGCEDSMPQGDMRVFRWLLEDFVYNQGDTLSWWVRFEVEEFDGTAEVCVEFNEPLP